MLDHLRARADAQTAANGGRPRRIALTDSTFRDGQQCLWATRMRTEHMLPVAPLFDGAGFETLECVAIVQFDGAVIYLQEDPFERFRLLRERIRNTPIRGALRSNLLHGFAPLGFDISELFIERQIANGAREIAFLESLHAWEIIAPGVKKAKEEGAITTVAVLYNDAPGYDAAYYEAVARDAVEMMAPDKIMFADAGGTMTLEKTREIIPAVRAGMGPDVRLEFNTHCLTGLGPLLALEAVTLGADGVFVTTEPMAFGPAPPGALMVARSLRELGYEVDVDEAALERIGEYLGALAAREGKPLGRAAEYDPRQYQTQYAGGALENMKAQLAAAGIADRLPEVLDEITRVRLDLGSPIMATPFPAIVAAQAVMNVLHGERYKVVPDEVKKYACGHYGRLRIPVDPQAMDRIVANGSKNIALDPPALPPVLPELRKRYPGMDPDQMILRFMYGDERIDALRPARTDLALDTRAPELALFEALAKAATPRNLSVSGDDFSFRAG